MDKSSIQLTNMDKLKSTLKQIPDKMASKVVVQMEREILNKIVKPAIKSKNPYPQYNQDIKISKRKGRNPSVGIGFSSDAYPLRFIEYGTNQRQIKGKGYYSKTANRGIMPKKPFLERIYKDTVGDVIKKVMDEGSDIITKLILRNMRNQARSINRKIKNM